MEHEHLIQVNYYHIFNRVNNYCNLFENPTEFEHFLWLYNKYISPVADTLAWVLMRNHFHLLVYIKKDMVYKYSIETLNRISPDKIWFGKHKWKTVDADLSASARSDNTKVGKKPIPYRHFSHLYNAYSQYLQVRTGRTGILFERPFKRLQVENEEYQKRVILYIHQNPVYHGFCSHPLEYSWSSYLSGISSKPTKLKRDKIIQLFNGREKFEHQHTQEINIREIEKWLEIAPLELHDYDLNLYKHDADRSIDSVRYGETDLSVCTATDNVKIMEDNVDVIVIDNVIMNDNISTMNDNGKDLKQQTTTD